MVLGKGRGNTVPIGRTDGRALPVVKHGAVGDATEITISRARAPVDFLVVEEIIFIEQAHGLEQAVKFPLYDCMDCGDCSLPDIAYQCPEGACAKNQRNGPCGGTDKGKCEIDRNKDCAWTLIYRRLDDLGKLDAMRKLQRPRNYLGEPQPGKIEIQAES